ncbi:MAG: hypothetical protein WD876_02090 [Candidatus Pacearchaeota archaeon]
MIKITPDKEKAKSIFEMIKSREQFLKEFEKKSTYPTIIAENYYEIIKELCTAIALTEGYKSAGENAHKNTIDFVKKYGFSESDIDIIQDLRVRRNKGLYEGRPVEKIYLENLRNDLLQIISNLKNILKNILKGD